MAEEVKESKSKSGSRGQKRKSRNWLRGLKWVAVAAVVVVVIYFIWLWLFAYQTCETWDCFNARLGACKKTEFIGGEEMIFEYIIRGRHGDFCGVDVELLQGDLNNQDSMKLEGHEMECMLPYGAVMIPQSDIDNCHGLLKEGLQDLVIRDLHAYIVQNLGRINLDILPPPE